LNEDFRDLFAAFNAAAAEYLLVGGYAVAFHAEPRFTKDLDVWVQPTPANAQRVLAGLRAFGAPLQGLTAAELAEAWPARVVTSYGEQALAVIGREHLIVNKRASGRPQDLLDVELLLHHGGERR
jgi:hypothetical protein